MFFFSFFYFMLYKYISFLVDSFRVYKSLFVRYPSSRNKNSYVPPYYPILSIQGCDI